MQIQLGAAAAMAAQIQAENRAARMETHAGKDIDTIVADGEPATTIESEPAETKELSGVLRLLQEGHFKGVADVRLRIAHADRIAALESEQTQANITDSSASLTSSISSIVTELAGASDTISAEEADAAIVAFEGQVGGAIDTLLASDAFDVEAVGTTMQVAFQSLVDQLGLGSTAEALTPAAIEVSAGSDPVAIEPETGSRDFLAELNEIFSGELSRILASMESNSMLPPISEPNGNGRAFEKFLALYNEMQNAGEVIDDSPTIEIDA